MNDTERIKKQNEKERIKNGFCPKCEPSVVLTGTEILQFCPKCNWAKLNK